MNTAEPIIEVFILEEDLKDDCACESLHKFSECTVEVTHLVSSCKTRPQGRRVCRGAAERHTKCMKEGSLCSMCGRPTLDCWTVRPI